MPDQDAAGKAAGAGVTLRPRRTQDKRRCGTEEPRQYLVAAVTGWVNRSLATATARRPCKLGARSKHRPELDILREVGGASGRPAGNARTQSGRRPGRGRIAAETIELFPPGIPVIAPDWPINSACLDALEQARAAGGRVVASDPSLEPSPLSRAPALANRPDRRSFRSGSPSATPACQGRPRPPARAGSPGNSVSASRHRRCQPGD